MNIIERLISGYPQGDVSPQDFIDHLSIGADGWIGAWASSACFSQCAGWCSIGSYLQNNSVWIL